MTSHAANTPPRERTPSWGDEVLRIAPKTSANKRTASTPFERPTAPASCADDQPETFVPDPLFAEWITETFLSGTGDLSNDEHQHLLAARLGVLWTNAINVSKQRNVLATAEIPQAMAGGWKRARFELQIREWFGIAPHFLLTFSAPECEQLSDRAFCALVEHELYHCAQAVDRFGNPKFSDDSGEPVFAIKGHDVEEFVGVVRRYGATTEDVRALVHAANTKPLISEVSLDLACGTCLSRAA